MTIGQALKSFRLIHNLTQSEMAGNIMNESFYSKVERDIHHIDAQDLLGILIANHIDIVAFFSMLGNQPDQENPTFDLEAKIGYAQNKKDLKTLAKIERELEEQDLRKDQILRMQIRLQMARAWIKHSNEDVSIKVKNRIKRVLAGKWDRISYHYLSQAVILLDIKEAYTLVKSAFDYYRKNPAHDTFTLQFVALLAVNYLNCCYHENGQKYSKIATDLLEDLPLDPTLGFYKTLGFYYETLFNGDQKELAAIVKIIKKVGFYPAIADTLPA